MSARSPGGLHGGGKDRNRDGTARGAFQAQGPFAGEAAEAQGGVGLAPRDPVPHAVSGQMVLRLWPPLAGSRGPRGLRPLSGPWA